MRKLCQRFLVEAKTTSQKRKKISEEWLQLNSLVTFAQRSTFLLTLNNTGANVETELIMSKATGGAKDAIRKRKEAGRFLIKFPDCDVYLCLNKNRIFLEQFHQQ